MSIIDELIAPPEGDAPLREVRVCAFWTAVVLEGGLNRDGGHELPDGD